MMHTAPQPESIMATLRLSTRIRRDSDRKQDDESAKFK